MKNAKINITQVKNIYRAIYAQILKYNLLVSTFKNFCAHKENNKILFVLYVETSYWNDCWNSQFEKIKRITLFKIFDYLKIVECRKINLLVKKHHSEYFLKYPTVKKSRLRFLKDKT